jgi:hypothetical protein
MAIKINLTPGGTWAGESSGKTVIVFWAARRLSAVVTVLQETQMGELGKVSEFINSTSK